MGADDGATSRFRADIEGLRGVAVLIALAFHTGAGVLSPFDLPVIDTANFVGYVLRTVPPLLLRAAALANRTLRELVERQYQFEEPFVVDSTRIASRLGVVATPLEQALASTLRGYAHFAAA